MKPIPDSVAAALVIHPAWAALMIASPKPLHTMGIDSAYAVARDNPIAAIAVMSAASSGAWLSHLDRFHGKLAGFMLISTQQFLMLWGLWTIIECAFGLARGDGVARYANGYAPPEGWPFIIADQILFAVVALLHTRQIWLAYMRPHE